MNIDNRILFLVDYWRIFVVEEPDEEPKVYPQKPNESLRTSPIAPAKPIEFQETQRSKRRKAKKKSRRVVNAENSNPNENNNRKSTNLFHTPSYSRYYEPQAPSRGFVKDNEFRVPSQPNAWVRRKLNVHRFDFRFEILASSRLSSSDEQSFTSFRSINEWQSINTFSRSKVSASEKSNATTCPSKSTGNNGRSFSFYSCSRRTSTTSSTNSIRMSTEI